MEGPHTQPAPPRSRLPILARHAISLAVVFALALPLSYFVGQRIYRNNQLGKLESPDREVFDEGLRYVYKRTPGSPEVVKRITVVSIELPPDRAAELLLTAAVSVAETEEEDESAAWARDALAAASVELFGRLEPQDAIGFYDAMSKIAGMPADTLAAAMFEQLDVPEDAQFLQIIDLLETRLLWAKNGVPKPMWLRWLGLLANSPAELSQLKSAQLLGELPDDVDRLALKQTLDLLAKSPHDKVRAQTLNTAAGYAAIAEPPTDYEQIIFTLGHDENPIIARRAWLVVGHLNPLSGYAVKWKEAGPFVAEAMLWASVKTNPENPKAALEALRLKTHAAQALLAMIARGGVEFDRLDATLHQHILRLQEDRSNHRAVWRALLAIQTPAEYHEPWGIHLWSYLDRDADPPEDFQLSLAACHRRDSFDLPGGFTWTQEERSLGELAAIEGMALSRANRPESTTTPQSVLAQLVAAATATHLPNIGSLAQGLSLDAHTITPLLVLAIANADPGETGGLLRSPQEGMMTATAFACAISGQRPTLIAGITLDFLRQHPDLDADQLAERSDAELAELGLKRVDALAALLEAAEAAPPSAGRQAEVKLLKLALWMRGDLGEDFTPTAEAMLLDDGLPTSTVLMCLLQMKRPIALEYLFGDLTSDGPDLHELFIQQRWWHVFRRFVDTSDLTLWLWGDPEAQAFQIEAMRQWYAVNRWKIGNGWWPEPGTRSAR